MMLLTKMFEFQFYLVIDPQYQIIIDACMHCHKNVDVGHNGCKKKVTFCLQVKILKALDSPILNQSGSQFKQAAIKPVSLWAQQLGNSHSLRQHFQFPLGVSVCLCCLQVDTLLFNVQICMLELVIQIQNTI